jgi:hypothetical protein
MTPEEHNLLERTLKLAEENNAMLKSIRRSNRLSVIMRVVYWVVILGLSYGAFFFIQPYINSLMGLYNGAQQNVSDAKSVSAKISSYFQ